MSTRIYKSALAGARRVPASLAAAALFLTAGCLPTLPGFTPDSGVTGKDGKPVLPALSLPHAEVMEAATLADGNIIVRGPHGYCVEGGSLRNRKRESFALLARCDLLRGEDPTDIPTLAVLTVTLVPLKEGETLPTASELAETFAPLPVRTKDTLRDVRLLHLSEGGDVLTEIADPKHWRGAFELNGYAVGLAAYGIRDGLVAADDGQFLLLDLARSIREASPFAPDAKSAEKQAAPTKK
jgi:hypothetical protein